MCSRAVRSLGESRVRQVGLESKVSVETQLTVEDGKFCSRFEMSGQKKTHEELFAIRRHSVNRSSHGIEDEAFIYDAIKESDSKVSDDGRQIYFAENFFAASPNGYAEDGRREERGASESNAVQNVDVRMGEAGEV